MAADTQDKVQDAAPPIRHTGRGFASMDPERQREIASQGGRAAHERGTAHEFDSVEARAAGRKGGEVSGAHRGAHALGESGEPAAPQASVDLGDDSVR